MSLEDGGNSFLGVTFLVQAISGKKDLRGTPDSLRGAALWGITS